MTGSRTAVKLTTDLAAIVSILVLCVSEAFPQSAFAQSSGGSFFNPSIGAAATSGSSGSTTDQLPSFFGWKQNFYQFGPHTGKEDLLPNFSTEQGQDPSATLAGPPQGGMTPSGLQPTATEQASKTQAKQYTQGQAVPHPFIQKEITIDTNPLKTHWGPPQPGDIPFLHVLPHNPNPGGMNSQALQDKPYMTGGTFASDLVQHGLRLSAAQKTAEKILDPNLQTAQAGFQGGVQQTADATSQDASGGFQGNLGQQTSYPLINVANEEAASPASAGQLNRSLPQAIWIVQQMYKRFFLPFSLLLLLVGAVATQTTNYVKFSFIEYTQLQMQVMRPFEGILRAIVALFLIGAIQLITSYFIDFGNSVTQPVVNLINQETLLSWTQAFTNPTQGMNPQQAANYYVNETTAASTGRMVFGSVQALLNTGLMVLSVYQVVMACYLFLLGPIAAALYAWPEAGTRFRTVFSNWLNGMSSLVLWRFWWCVILLVMATRIQWLQNIGAYNPASPWEPIVYTAFMVMLTYVPFAALDFKPGDLVESVLQKAAPKQH